MGELSSSEKVTGLVVGFFNPAAIDSNAAAALSCDVGVDVSSGVVFIVNFLPSFVWPNRGKTDRFDSPPLWFRVGLERVQIARSLPAPSSLQILTGGVLRPTVWIVKRPAPLHG